MANLPQQHPTLSLHLADRALTPLISSSFASSPPSSRGDGGTRQQLQQDALATLTSAALTFRDTAARLGLGSPQRALVEYGPTGPLIIQTFLDPAAASHPYGGAVSSSYTSTSTFTTTSPAAAGGASSSPAVATPPPSSSSSRTEKPKGGCCRGRSDGDDVDDEGELVNGVSRLGPNVTRGGGNEDNDNGDTNSNSRTPRPAEAGASTQSEAAPMLIGLVLAPSAEETAEARRAIARLERIGREIQAALGSKEG